MMAYLTRPRLKDGTPPPKKPYNIESFKMKSDLYLQGFLGTQDKDYYRGKLQSEIDKAVDLGVVSEEDAYSFIRERNNLYKDLQDKATDQPAVLPKTYGREEFSEGTKTKLVKFVEDFKLKNNRAPTIMEIAQGSKSSTASIKKYLKEGEDFKISSKLEAAKLGGKKATGITKINDKLVEEFKDLKIKGISPSVETTKAGSKSFRIRFDKKLGLKDIFLPATQENLETIKNTVSDTIESKNYTNNIKPFQTDEDKRKIKRFKEAQYKKKDPFGVYKKLQEYKTEKFPGTLSKELQIQHGQPKFTTQTLSRFGLIPADVNISAPVEKAERIRNNSLKIAMSKLTNPNRSIADKEKIIEEFNDTMKGLRGQLKGTPAQGLVNFELLNIDQDGNITKLKDTGFNPKKGFAYGNKLGDLDLSKITKEQADDIINLGKKKIDIEAIKLKGVTTADKIARPEKAILADKFKTFGKYAKQIAKPAVRAISPFVPILGTVGVGFGAADVAKAASMGYTKPDEAAAAYLLGPEGAKGLASFKEKIVGQTDETEEFVP